MISAVNQPVSLRAPCLQALGITTLPPPKCRAAKIAEKRRLTMGAYPHSKAWKLQPKRKGKTESEKAGSRRRMEKNPGNDTK